MTATLRKWWRRVSVSPALIPLTRRRILWQWRLRGSPAPPPHVVKQDILLRYQQQRRFRTFIETGTFTGEMIAAMRPHFARLISIEMAPAIFEATRRRFAGDSRIELLLGDSAMLLPSVLARLEGPALFWLDGHYMGGTTARAEQDSPVKAELAALLRHPARGHLVLIDDARLFTGVEGYPTFDELREWVVRERPGSRVERDADIIRCAFDAADAVSSSIPDPH
jgi:SAM-dependent methyltransferase